MIKENNFRYCGVLELRPICQFQLKICRVSPFDKFFFFKNGAIFRDKAKYPSVHHHPIDISNKCNRTRFSIVKFAFFPPSISIHRIVCAGFSFVHMHIYFNQTVRMLSKRHTNTTKENTIQQKKERESRDKNR